MAFITLLPFVLPNEGRMQYEFIQLTAKSIHHHTFTLVSFVPSASSYAFGRTKNVSSYIWKNVFQKILVAFITLLPFVLPNEGRMQ
ncbi:hypothetical protein BKI52_11730 [marine bacterium AO1-C]|nr:hypothetical protein BKI52_11730 [marine bacterium AO1-C]